MPKKLETSFGRFFKLPNPGLRAYFQHVVSGQPEVYRTTFYKGRSVQSLLKEWNSHLDQIREKFPELCEFEDDLGAKVGPMSVMKPLKDRMADIDSYYDSILLESKPVSEAAIRSAVKEWSDVAGVRVRSESKTVENMKKSTNSGSPYFTKRRRVIPLTVPVELYNRAPGDYIQVLGDRRKHWNVCAVLGWRGQEGGPRPEDVKQRVVWMFPFAVNIAELQVYQPLIEAMQSGRVPHVPAWVSMDAVDHAITKMFDTKGPDDLVICTDFSKFDQHFNKDLQACASQCLRALFTKSDARFANWIRNVFPIKYEIPLAYDFGKIRYGSHGMASGSGGTNADETLAHRCLQHEAAISSGQVLNPNSQCLGDDGVLTYPGITVKDVMSAYTSHGLEMNEEKQYASTHDCVYLRRWHDKDYRVDGVCVGVYSTNRALGRLCEQERYYDPEFWDRDMVAIRQLSILENCKYHPLREEFADWCMKGDKYRLGLDIPGFFDDLERRVRKAIDYMPDFLGYTRSLQRDGNPKIGIDDWWIVKYLKSKA